MGTVPLVRTLMPPKGWKPTPEQTAKWMRTWHAHHADREASFWDRVVEDDTGCWYRSGVSPGRYDELWLGGRRQGAHRYAYEALVGPIPEGLQIDHLCRHPRCVNPGHMEPVTIRENVLRGIGRSAVNARKTECFRGHPLTPDNIYPTRNGRGRACRICDLAGQARRKARRRAVMIGLVS